MFDAILGQSLRAIFTAIADVNKFALRDVVRVGGHLLDEFEVLADHDGNLFQRVDEPSAPSSGLASSFCWRPVPREQFFKSILGAILDPSQDICQTGLPIAAVQFDSFDDGQDAGDALTALVRSGNSQML